jgi:hypothetical protein
MHGLMLVSYPSIHKNGVICLTHRINMRFSPGIALPSKILIPCILLPELAAQILL